MERRTSSRVLVMALLTAAIGFEGAALAADGDVACAPGQMRCTTQAQRAAAAARLKEFRKNKPKLMAPQPGERPEYFGPWPNWAFTPPLRKFVDTLPQLGVANNLGQMITIGSPDKLTFSGSDYYEIAVQDYCERMHSDFPPVTLKTGRGCQGGTLLRGYVQVNLGTNQAGTTNNVAPPEQHYLGPILIGQMDRPIRIKFINKVSPGNLGDLFIPTDLTAMGAGLGVDWKGDGTTKLFSQNRATLHLHGGDNPWISDGTPHQWVAPVTENSSVHQYKDPETGVTTPYTAVKKGVSTAYVPDMWYDNRLASRLADGTYPVIASCVKALTCAAAGATNDPGPGAMTFYYPNQQSARLMFYHDHAYGITRLNVYAGEAAGYLIQDPVEQKLVNGGSVTVNGTTTTFVAGTVPAAQIPIVIQDKTFVDATGDQGTNTNHVLNTDPTWNWGRSAPVPVTGDLWFPHVPNPNQNPADLSGANSVGRWDYGPWFWPVFANVSHAPLTSADPWCAAQNIGGWDPALFQCPNFPVPSLVPEGFGDTAVVNGTAYPTVVLEPKAYRLRILNASNDRSLNLSLFQASGLETAIVTAGTGLLVGSYSAPITGCTSTPLTAAATATVTTDPTVGSVGGALSAITVTQPTSWPQNCTVPLTVDLSAIPVDPAATVIDPNTGLPVPSPAYNPPAAAAAWNTEVKMLQAVNGGTCIQCNPNNPPFPPLDANDPRVWPTDNRVGGVPDPRTVGPDFMLIGTEGGLLPQVATVRANPTNYVYNRRDIIVLSVSEHGLFLQPAERADAVVDFSAFAGKTLILYNDSPSPVPASDPRNDYYTGDPDFSMETGDGTGGHATTLPGYGPNVRTLMQFQIAASPVVAFDKNVLAAALPVAFAASQPPPIVPEPAFNAAYGKSFTATYGRIQSTSLTFQPQELVGTASTAKTTIPLQPKAIQELFEMDYGRMNATLGVELPFTTSVNQTTIPYGFIDPLTETFAGTTQLWKITHNGVDSHPVHFHLYNVQVLNRVGWDGAIRPAEAHEVGWKETVRMNPLEDVVVAARPLLPELPFPLPDSIRPLDVMRPIGSSGPQYTNVDPKTGNPVTVTNQYFNYGHEYVWHCHILGHEENDFMRPMRAQKPANDFNYDQNAEIIMRNRSNGQLFAYFMKTTTTTGGTSLPYTSGTAWAPVGWADFNHDGHPDMVYRNTNTQAVAVWFLKGTSFVSSTSLSTPGAGWTIGAVADFDGDGNPDILWRYTSLVGLNAGKNAIWLMNGTTYLSTVNLPAQTTSGWEIAGAADFDFDGTPDIAWRNVTTGANEVWTIDPRLGAAPRKAILALPVRPGANFKFMGVADFNQDAMPDMLFRKTNLDGMQQVVFLNGVTQIGTSTAGQAVSNQSWEIVGPK